MVRGHHVVHRSDIETQWGRPTERDKVLRIPGIWIIDVSVREKQTKSTYRLPHKINKTDRDQTSSCYQFPINGQGNCLSSCLHFTLQFRHKSTSKYRVNVSTLALCVPHRALIRFASMYVVPTYSLIKVYITFTVSYFRLHVPVTYWPSSGLTSSCQENILQYVIVHIILCLNIVKLYSSLFKVDWIKVQRFKKFRCQLECCIL